MQGTAADGFKKALVELDSEFSVKDASIVHILHDEIIVEVREDIADDIAEVVRECMEGAFNKMFPDVPFVVEPEIRDSWGTLPLGNSTSQDVGVTHERAINIEREQIYDRCSFLSYHQEQVQSALLTL